MVLWLVFTLLGPNKKGKMKPAMAATLVANGRDNYHVGFLHQCYMKYQDAFVGKQAQVAMILNTSSRIQNMQLNSNSTCFFTRISQKLTLFSGMLLYIIVTNNKITCCLLLIVFLLKSSIDIVHIIVCTY